MRRKEEPKPVFVQNVKERRSAWFFHTVVFSPREEEVKSEKKIL